VSSEKEHKPAEPKPDAAGEIPPPSDYAPHMAAIKASRRASEDAARMHAAAVARVSGMANLTLTADVIPSLIARVNLSVTSIIIPERPVAEGTLIRGTGVIWHEIVQHLGSNWDFAYELPSERWEELIAGAFKKAGYDDVTLTPRSGDHGRDVIAIRRGFGCVKVLGSVKAYAPGNLVPYDAVRALIGVLTGEQDASKGIITTTSDFPPKILEDPFIAPFTPYRLELVNGTRLRQWLMELANANK
jgi:restriction system protein